MTAGLNVRVRFWQLNQQPDDEVGGSIISGSSQGLEIRARFEQIKPNFLLLQQGMEVEKQWGVTLNANVIGNITEHDQLEITYPLNHPFYGKLFSIMSIDYSSHHPSDARGYVILYVKRVEFSRSLRD